MERVIFGLVLFAVIGFVGGAVAAIPFMLATGVLHGYWAEVPAFTFWQSFAITWAVGAVFSRSHAQSQ